MNAFISPCRCGLKVSVSCDTSWHSVETVIFTLFFKTIPGNDIPIQAHCYWQTITNWRNWYKYMSQVNKANASTTCLYSRSDKSNILIWLTQILHLTLNIFNKTIHTFLLILLWSCNSINKNIAVMAKFNLIWRIPTSLQ